METIPAFWKEGANNSPGHTMMILAQFWELVVKIYSESTSILYISNCGCSFFPRYPAFFQGREQACQQKAVEEALSTASHAVHVLWIRLYYFRLTTFAEWTYWKPLLFFFSKICRADDVRGKCYETEPGLILWGLVFPTLSSLQLAQLGCGTKQIIALWQ